MCLGLLSTTRHGLDAVSLKMCQLLLVWLLAGIEKI
jgi:hypothetical protein